ncbi:glycosyltransferase involved in cell wall biosynthesis [Spirosoma lacussanchae]|uniref:glycosyltransferase n=1 Tax=Spirosoma lacussanchae TaxID=1884249 RepID=UPI001107C7D4|nr:glycosyltransferase [Spirosoma lacussanchae]
MNPNVFIDNTPFDGIVCIGQTSWEGNFQKAVVQLMTELSARHRVVFVDYQYTLKDLAKGLTGRTDIPVRPMLGLAPSLNRKLFDNGTEAYIWHPPVMLPINWLSARSHDRVVRWNVNRLTAGLRTVMKQLGISRPLVINAFNPVFGLPMLRQLNEWATIYYCFDEITMSRWMSRHGGRYEPLYLQGVDAVVTTSETLRQSKSMLQPRTFCVKNGVNFELFNKARSFTDQTAPDRPVVGYLGTADDRINLPLVEHCVRTMPDLDFMFVGEVNEPTIRVQLAPYPNVKFVPPHQPAELPPLLARMSAAMIPFVCNEHTYTIYPLKINEYLAAGLPVVSTPFSLLDDFAGIVELADTPDAFVAALRRALADTSRQRLDQRIALARANSWSHRSEEFEAVIRQLQPA